MKPVVFLLADAGYSSYGSLIQTSDKLVQEKPDLVQRFVDASIEGWYSYLYGDPAPGQRADQTRQSGDDRRAARLWHRQIKEYGIVDSGDAQDKRHRRDDRCSAGASFSTLMASAGALSQGSRLPQGVHLAVRQQESRHESLTQ